jgi:ribonuclease P protein component
VPNVAFAKSPALFCPRKVAHLPTQGRAGWDYVLIGRHLETADRPFHLLVQDLETALSKIHAPRKPRK